MFEWLKIIYVPEHLAKPYDKDFLNETKVRQQSPIVSDKTIEQLNGRDAPHEN
jgi:hypothetical protein